MSVLVEFLKKFKPAQCNVGVNESSDSNTYDNSNVRMTGGDWPSAIKDIYSWAETVYNRECGERGKSTNTELLPSTPSNIDIDCSGGVTQAIRSYWFRMKLKNSPGFDEETYKKYIETTKHYAVNMSSDSFSATNLQMLKDLGFEYHPYNVNSLQPYDIIGATRKNWNCGGDKYGHAQIVGEKTASGFEVYSTTTNHCKRSKPYKTHYTVKELKLSCGRFYNAIYRLKK